MPDELPNNDNSEWLDLLVENYSLLYDKFLENIKKLEELKKKLNHY